MTTQFDRATARTLALLMRKLGVSVTYRRGTASITVTAIRGQSQTTLDSPNGARLRIDSADYLIDAADLDFGSGPTEPLYGDEIVDGEQTHEVVSAADGAPVWQWHDRTRIRRRIHVVER